MDEVTKTNQTGVTGETYAEADTDTSSAADADGTEAENPYVDKLAPIYHKATSTYSKMMAPIHEMNQYVDEKNALDAQYKDQAESEEYQNAVKELQTNYFGEDAVKLNIANKFEKVQDFADSHGITAVGAAMGNVGSKIKDAFSKTSAGQTLEEIKMAAAEIEETQATEDTATASTEDTASAEDTAEDTVTASAEVSSEESKESIVGKIAGKITAATSALRGQQAASYLGVSEMEGTGAETDRSYES